MHLPFIVSCIPHHILKATCMAMPCSNKQNRVILPMQEHLNDAPIQTTIILEVKIIMDQTTSSTPWHG